MLQHWREQRRVLHGGFVLIEQQLNRLNERQHYKSASVAFLFFNYFLTCLLILDESVTFECCAMTPFCSLVFPFTMVHSGMLWHSDMGGLPSTSLFIVPVVLPCQCSTLFCPKGSFPTLRHNEVRDLTANLMAEVCHHVCNERHLQPVTGETLSGASTIAADGARLDVAASGFCGGRHERAFFDVRVFNPHACRIISHSPPAIANTRTPRNEPTTSASER